MNAWQLFIKGGPVMWPILLCSLVSLTLFFDRISYFSSISTDIYFLKSRIFELLKQNKVKDAVVLCEQNSSPVAKILKAGIVNYGSHRDQIKEAMQDASHFEIPLLERNLPMLSTLSHIVPLLGLLGTVTGMASSFYMIQVRSAAMNPVVPGDIAGGIWQALLTTVFGLIVAIPTVLAYNYCVSRVNVFVLDMERAATELIQLLSQLSESNAQ
jgi:biopolymer transport protein ExbB